MPLGPQGGQCGGNLRTLFLLVIMGTKFGVRRRGGGSGSWGAFLVLGGRREIVFIVLGK